jgi:hypothetical protein
MSVTKHHPEETVIEMAVRLQPVFDKSWQAIYIYQNDAHKVCNKNFAEMVGYESAGEWAKVEAPLSDVVEEDRPAVIAAYENASKRMEASCLNVRLKNIKNSKIIETNLIVVPLTDGSNNVFTANFFSRK